MSILSRLFPYSQKIFGLATLLEAITDRREAGRIETSVVAKATFAMLSARLGSLNATEQTKGARFWRKHIGAELPSADTCGRVMAQMESDGWRNTLHAVYSTLKRNKAFPPSFQGMVTAVLDGHESHATYNQCCFGCLSREMPFTINGEECTRTQYYHRNVTISLIGKDFDFLLDAEPVFSGEDEVAAAIRLFERVVQDYPRAFDMVLGDALYTDPRFFSAVIEAGKHAFTVLKDDRRKLIQDAKQMFQTAAPLTYMAGRTCRTVWDLEGFDSWPQVGASVRVIRSEENTPVKRQLSKETEICRSQWLWVSTLPQSLLDTKTAVELGHGRWNIENRGFNQLVSHWSADHVYMHDPVAILNFWLATMLAHNIFMAFYHRNLKPVLRSMYTMLHISRLIASELYASLMSPALSP